jgi:glycine/D-amino acid oxidase-like deaminating enzyme/nitrite reductase/ring-hydroxylating ferredoxin subunit
VIERADRDGDTTPFWELSRPVRRYQRLNNDIEADVVIVGAGVTGLTAALLLADAGRRVVVLERDRCGGGDTSHTTAHLTMVTDMRLTELAERFGTSHAQAVWDAGLAAIATIDDIVRDHHIDAAFGWVDGYVHVPAGTAADVETERALAEEARLAAELGFDAHLIDDVPLVGGAGVRVTGQARIHAGRYLAGLAEAFVASGGQIFEESPAEDYRGAPRAVISNGHFVVCDHIVMTTHNPQPGLAGAVSAALFQTKLALYSSYVVAGRVAHGTVPDALWWDTADPYRYLRVHSESEHDVVILGGEDHKTGQGDPDGSYRRLEDALQRLVPDVDITHRWSGQVVETPDGLPYIGEYADRQFVATGFSGNGMTFGTLAGVMIADAITGRVNPWRDLFDPGRKALTKGLWDYLTENADYPYYMIRDRFAGGATADLRTVSRGQGALIERHGTKIAVYRDDRGVATCHSGICTHLGCVVRWNTAERTWDCPCHGSRFSPSGEVISGPAERPLADLSIDKPAGDQ